MRSFSRKQLLIILPVVLLLAAGIWYYVRRPQPVVMASYVPESALGYVEVNDWPQLVRLFTATNAWQRLAPAYGIADKLNYAGQLGGLARFAGGEAAVLGRAQFALVVTSLEARGEEIKPRWALLAETHSRASSLRAVIERRAPELAQSIFGPTVKETADYNGVAITIYRAPNTDRRLLSAQIEGEWLLANHTEALQACIDARQGRAPALANNSYLQTARPLVGGNAQIFGYVTPSGVARLLRFGAFLMAGGAVSKAVLAGAMGEVLTDFSTRAANGIAYGASFENSAVIDRYALLFNPDLVASLKPVVKINTSEPRSLNFVPALAEDVTIINVENPTKTLDGIEAVIAARVGAGQSFLLHQFLLGAREVFFGLQADKTAAAAIGDEIASFGLSDEYEDRVWLIAARDRESLLNAAKKFPGLTNMDVRESYKGAELLGAGDGTRSGAAFVGDFLALGRRAALRRFLDAQSGNQVLRNAPHFVAAYKTAQPAAILSFSAVKEEADEMMLGLAQLLRSAVKAQAGQAQLEQLPLAVSATSLNEQGVMIEARSPFGNFPFFISIVAGVTDAR
jgi:hypothetical protein